MVRKRYSTELKLEIVRQYFEKGKTVYELKKEYDVTAHADIQKWIALYRKHGPAGLSTRTWTYTGDFKIYVVEYMHKTGASIRSTAAHFNIPSPSSVAKWERIYYEYGKDALYEEFRGRTSSMKRNKSNKTKQAVDTNKDLLEEVQRLRMENEYLKKLNALVQEREKFERATKLLSSQN